MLVKHIISLATTLVRITGWLKCICHFITGYLKIKSEEATQGFCTLSINIRHKN